MEINKIPDYAKKFSEVLSKLVVYSATNGLIYFFAARANCKSNGMWEILALPAIFILFLVFILDVFINDFPLFKKLEEKGLLSKRNIPILLLYTLVAISITWLYVSGIYNPLFLIPSEIWECKSQH